MKIGESMMIAEELAFSIEEERHGLHILLWDDQDDLCRALVILLARFGNTGGIKILPILVSTEEHRINELRNLIERQRATREDDPVKNLFRILFIQHASNNKLGPWLNGWRRPLCEPPGALLVIRSADFDSFQRNAPDLVSLAGPKLYDASVMLSVFSENTYKNMKAGLPSDIETILKQLPGTLPEEQEIEDWIEAYAPVDKERS